MYHKQTIVYNQTFLVSHKRTIWAVMTTGQSSHFKTVISKKNFKIAEKQHSSCQGEAWFWNCNHACLLPLQLIMAISCLYLYLGVTIWVIMTEALYSSFPILLVPGFILFWQFSTGWVGFCPVTSITNQATFHTAFTLCHCNRYQRKCVIITLISLRLCRLITSFTCSYNILNFNCPNDTVWVFSFIHWSVMSAKHTTLSWPWSADTVSSKAVSFESPQYLLAYDHKFFHWQCGLRTCHIL